MFMNIYGNVFKVPVRSIVRRVTPQRKVEAREAYATSTSCMVIWYGE